MKHTPLATFALIAGLMLASQVVAGPNEFPEVGKSYRIEFPSAENLRFLSGAHGGGGKTVKIVARAEHGWCLVEYRFVEGRDAATMQPIIKNKTVWLNFNHVLLAIPE